VCECPLWGQKQTLRPINAMSALPPKADIDRRLGNGFVPVPANFLCQQFQPAGRGDTPSLQAHHASGDTPDLVGLMTDIDHGHFRLVA
jgi:hypothetical protein